MSGGGGEESGTRRSKKRPYVLYLSGSDVILQPHSRSRASERSAFYLSLNQLSIQTYHIHSLRICFCQPAARLEYLWRKDCQEQMVLLG